MGPCLGAAAVPGAEEAHAHLPVLVQVRVQPVRAVRDVVKGRRHTRIVRPFKEFRNLGTITFTTANNCTVQRHRHPKPNLPELISGSYWYRSTIGYCGGAACVCSVVHKYNNTYGTVYVTYFAIMTPVEYRMKSSKCMRRNPPTFRS